MCWWQSRTRRRSRRGRRCTRRSSDWAATSRSSRTTAIRTPWSATRVRKATASEIWSYKTSMPPERAPRSSRAKFSSDKRSGVRGRFLLKPDQSITRIPRTATFPFNVVGELGTGWGRGRQNGNVHRGGGGDGNMPGPNGEMRERTQIRSEGTC